jgi:molybdenum transport protein
MINCLPDSDIDRFIEEDVPYGDLTTHLLGIGERPGRIIFSSREETTLCCTEEAARVLQKCGATLTSCMPSGVKARETKIIVEADTPEEAMLIAAAVPTSCSSIRYHPPN